MNRGDQTFQAANVRGHRQDDAFYPRTGAYGQAKNRGQQTDLPLGQRIHKGTPDLRTGEYSPMICDSPPSSESDDLMGDGQNLSSDQLPSAKDPMGAPAGAISRLSLEHPRIETGGPVTRHSRNESGALTSTSAKRKASRESPRRPSPHLRGVPGSPNIPGQPRDAWKDQRPMRNGRHVTHRVTSGEQLQRRMIEAKSAVRPFVQSHNRLKQEPKRGDSGYCSNNPSRANTGLHGNGGVQPNAVSVPPTVDEGIKTKMEQFPKSIVPLPASSRYPGLILQPESSPISQEQLAAEVKGIYAGLVMVEAKCINITAAQAADPRSQLASEQWQALIALHCTLLYEHHDFLMATQHPSATSALRGLATKYSMPARLWKHGIHAFLEVLRHRRPASQDYMLAFICLAYQMMALLFETVPSFTDTWIECLGDLARYRMAIEEEKEAHATWGGVAARWYTMASDRHPSIGRLYHHLGILERPSLRKFCFYAKSLTCVIPFANAKDSLATLCNPIVHDKQTIQSSSQSAEARIVTFHALIFSGKPQPIIDEVGADALELLAGSPSKLKDIGTYLAVTNTSALCEFGAPANVLFQQYMEVLSQTMQSSKASLPTKCDQGTQFPPAMISQESLVSYESTKSFWIDCFDLVLQNHDKAGTKECLSFIHVMLVALHSLHLLRMRCDSARLAPHPILEMRHLPWTLLADFLNVLVREESISDWTLDCARKGNFLTPEHKSDAKPLLEDYWIRGLVWAQFYFCPGWFDGQTETDGRAIETPSTHQARVQRVLWLGLYLAINTGYMQYDAQKKVFAACSAAQDLPTAASEAMPAKPSDHVEPHDVYTEPISVTPSPGSRSSTGRNSTSTNSEDDFVHVKMPRLQETAEKPELRTETRTTMASPPRKHKPDLGTFRVADEHGMVLSAEGAHGGY